MSRCEECGASVPRGFRVCEYCEGFKDDDPLLSDDDDDPRDRIEWDEREDDEDTEEAA